MSILDDHQVLGLAFPKSDEAEYCVYMQKELRTTGALALMAEWALYGIAGLIPLVTLSAGKFVLWETPKVALVNILTVIAVAVWAFDMIRSGHIRARIPPFFWLVLSYFGVYVVATIISISPVLSIFGIYYRSMGLITVANLVLLYFLVFNILSSRDRQMRCLKILVFSASVVALIGVLQYFGTDLLPGSLSARGQRVNSTLGNSDYVIGVMVLAIPVAAAFVLKKRYLYLAPLVLLSACLLFSLPIPGVTSEMPATESPRGVSGIQSTLGEVTASLSGSAADRFRFREGLWEAGIKSAFAHPVLGTGPNTYRDVFPQYEPLYYARMVGDNREDKVHNEFIEVAQSTGFVGLGAYLAMMASLLWLFGRWSLKNKRDPDAVFVMAVAVAAMGYLAFTFMLFHTIAPYTVFWILAGVGVGLCRPLGAGMTKKVRLSRMFHLAAAGLAITGVAWLGLTALRPVVAEMSFARARTVVEGDFGSGDDAMALFQKAADLHPYELTYLSVAGHAFSVIGRASAGTPVSRPQFEQAFYYIDRAVAQEPQNAGAYFDRALIYDRAGKSADEVLKELDRAIELNPYYVLALNLRADVHRMLGNYRQAISDRELVLIVTPGDDKVMGELEKDRRTLREQREK